MSSNAPGSGTRLTTRKTTGSPVGARGVIVVGALLLLCVLSGAWAAGSARADVFSAPYRVLPAAPTAEGTAAKAVSCPSATQCTAVSEYGGSGTGQELPDVAVTFDPATGQPNAAGITQIDARSVLQAGVSCPSTTQCTAFDGAGNEVTFDPTTGQPNAVGLTGIEPPRGASAPLPFVYGTCASDTECTGIDGTGEITFDPRTGTVNATGRRDFGNFAAGPVSCPLVTQCTTVTSPYGSANTEITFNPVTGADPAGERSVASTWYFPAVACPSATQCTATTTLGSSASGVATFDPSTGTPNPGGAADIPPRGQGYFTPSGISCSSVVQCTEIGLGAPPSNTAGRFFTSVTFDPASPAGASPSYAPIAKDDTPRAVACSSASRCVAVFKSGLAVNITPSVSQGGGNGATGVSLHGSPSGNGGAVTFALGCATSSSGCRVTSSLTSTETIRGSTVLGVSAVAKRHRTVVLGTRRVTIAAGKTITVAVALNATGRHLLVRFHRLPVQLRIAVAGVSRSTTRNVTVTPARSRHDRMRP